MGFGRFSRPQRGVGALAMLNAWLNITGRNESVSEIPPGAGVLRLFPPGMAVGVIIDSRCVADGVTVTDGVISATPELFSEDEGVEF
jgi:hypothetical protein